MKSKPNYLLDLNIIMHNGVIAEKPLVLTKTSDSVPSSIERKYVMESLSTKSSSMIFSSIEEVKKIIRYLPYILSIDNGCFFSIQENIKTIISGIEDSLSELKYSEVSERYYDNLKSNEGKGPFRTSIRTEIDLNQGSYSQWTTGNGEWLYTSYTQKIEEYGFVFQSHLDESLNPISYKSLFLDRNIITETVFNFEDGIVPSIEDISKEIYDRKKKTFEGLLFILRKWSALYDLVENGSFEDMVLDLTAE